MSDPLAQPADVADLWHPLSADEEARVTRLIAKASAKLRQKTPFNIDERVALFGTDPTQPTALDPQVVADVVAQVVHRFLVNPDGAAAESDGGGPFSYSATYVNRYDKTGSDVRGAIQVTDSDVEQLRPAQPAEKPFGSKVGVPHPHLLIPRGRIGGAALTGFGPGAVGPVIAPDYALGSGAE